MVYNGINLNINDAKEIAQYAEMDDNFTAAGCTSIKGIPASVAIANLKDKDTAKANAYNNKYDRPDGYFKVLTNTGDGINPFRDNLTVKCVTHKCHILLEKRDDGDKETSKSKTQGLIIPPYEISYLII